MHLVCGERGRAVLTSGGQVANSFHSVIYLLPQLPSSSSYSLHPPTDPCDQGPALAPLHPNTRQPSLCKRRGVEVRSCMSKDESCVNTVINKRLVDNEPLERPVCICQSRAKTCHVDGDASRQQIFFIFFRSLPHISEEHLQGTARWSDKLRVDC